MENFVGSPCSLNNSPVEGFYNYESSSNRAPLTRYKDFLGNLINHKADLHITNVDLEKLKKLDDIVALRELLWSILTSVYNNNSQLLDSTIDEIKRSDGLHEEQKKLADRDHTIMESLKGLNITNKRKISIENYAFEKTMYQLDFLKKVLIALAILIILPILRLTGIIGKGLALTLFFIVIVILVLYGVYHLYYKSLNRDENDFNKFNFGKPDAKQVLESKLNGRMSESDRQRCKNLQDIDSDEINPELLVISRDKMQEYMSDVCKAEPVVTTESGGNNAENETENNNPQTSSSTPFTYFFQM